MNTDRPKLLGERDARRIRQSQLREAHIAPLTAFVKSLRRKTDRGADIPYFDPWDGGVKAKILFLLEAPGQKAVFSGFISRNNPDPSAKNFFELNCEARIPRKSTVSWNAVPWFIGKEGKVRGANSADLEEGLRSLPRLLDLLPNLRAIVFMGKKAQRARCTAQPFPPKVRLFDCPHPSPRFVNRRRENRRKVLHVLLEVARYVGET